MADCIFLCGIAFLVGFKIAAHLGKQQARRSSQPATSAKIALVRREPRSDVEEEKL